MVILTESTLQPVEFLAAILGKLATFVGKDLGQHFVDPAARGP